MLLQSNFLTFAAGDFHYCACIVFLPLTNAAGNRLNPVIRLCRNVPEQINIPSVSDTIKNRGNDHYIDVAHLVGSRLRVRSIDDTELDREALFPEPIQIKAYTVYDRFINH